MSTGELGARGRILNKALYAVLAILAVLLGLGIWKLVEIIAGVFG